MKSKRTGPPGRKISAQFLNRVIIISNLLFPVNQGRRLEINYKIGFILSEQRLIILQNAKVKLFI
jgi:hypothetical protein